MTEGIVRTTVWFVTTIIWYIVLDNMTALPAGLVLLGAIILGLITCFIDAIIALLLASLCD